MRRYLIVVEKTRTGYSVYSPDLAGCIATGKTKEQVMKNIREAIEFHLERMRLEGYPIPKPRSSSSYVQVFAPQTARRLKARKIAAD